MNRAAAALLAVLVQACAAPPESGYSTFGEPRRVLIPGYEGDAMEPFISRDGTQLLFNNRNDPRVDTNLHFATRIDELRFRYGGELGGANTRALEGVPSVDDAGQFYFISTRSHAETLSTLYTGRLRNGAVSAVALVSGVSRRQPGIVMFDAEISAGGSVLWFAEGEFTGGPNPRSADIGIAVREGAGFRRLSPEILKNVNTSALEYAPAVSRDGLELFARRARRPGDLSRRAHEREARLQRAATRDRDHRPHRGAGALPRRPRALLS